MPNERHFSISVLVLLVCSSSVWQCKARSFWVVDGEPRSRMSVRSSQVVGGVNPTVQINPISFDWNCDAPNGVFHIAFSRRIRQFTLEDIELSTGRVTSIEKSDSGHWPLDMFLDSEGDDYVFSVEIDLVETGLPLPTELCVWMPADRAFFKRSRFGNRESNTLCIPFEFEPVDCQGEWIETSCSVSCGEGTKARVFVITQDRTALGHYCEAEEASTQIIQCNGGDCPIDCEGEYDEWGLCSSTCGGGFQSRALQITTPEQFGGAPCTNLFETQICNTNPCPVDCQGTQMPWGDCSKTCGTGIQTSRYVITFPAQFGGCECPFADQTMLERGCNHDPCPEPIPEPCPNVTAVTPCPDPTPQQTTNCSCPNATSAPAQIPTANCSSSGQTPCVQHCVGHFTEWSDCSQECGGGSQSRTFAVLLGESGGGDQCNHTNGYTETRDCHTQSCPVDCQGSFGNWSSCSRTCGTGVQEQTFTIATPSQHEGLECTHGHNDMAYRPCNTDPCPIDCIGYYDEWSSCSVTCGGGQRTRTFIEGQSAHFGGVACNATGGSQQIDLCNTHSCPVDCIGSWVTTQNCSVECGNGTIQQQYVVSQPSQFGGHDCEYTHEDTHILACVLGSCPDPDIDCIGKWVNVGNCSDECDGSQYQIFQHTTVAMGNGQECEYAHGYTQIVHCNPIDPCRQPISDIVRIEYTGQDPASCTGSPSSTMLVKLFVDSSCADLEDLFTGAIIPCSSGTEQELLDSAECLIDNAAIEIGNCNNETDTRLISVSSDWSCYDSASASVPVAKEQSCTDSCDTVDVCTQECTPDLNQAFALSGPTSHALIDIQGDEISSYAHTPDYEDVYEVASDVITKRIFYLESKDTGVTYSNKLRVAILDEKTLLPTLTTTISISASSEAFVALSVYNDTVFIAQSGMIMAWDFDVDTMSLSFVTLINPSFTPTVDIEATEWGVIALSDNEAETIEFDGEHFSFIGSLISWHRTFARVAYCPHNNRMATVTSDGSSNHYIDMFDFNSIFSILTFTTATFLGTGTIEYTDITHDDNLNTFYIIGSSYITEVDTEGAIQDGISSSATATHDKIAMVSSLTGCDEEEVLFEGQDFLSACIASDNLCFENKTKPGVCGCGIPDIDTDNDNVPDCIDPCPLSDAC